MRRGTRLNNRPGKEPVGKEKGRKTSRGVGSFQCNLRGGGKKTSLVNRGPFWRDNRSDLWRETEEEMRGRAGLEAVRGEPGNTDCEIQ